MIVVAITRKARALPLQRCIYDNYYMLPHRLFLLHFSTRDAGRKGHCKVVMSALKQAVHAWRRYEFEPVEGDHGELTWSEAKVSCQTSDHSPRAWFASEGGRWDQNVTE